MGRAPIRVHRPAQRDINHAVATARLWLAILAVVSCNRKPEEWVRPVTELLAEPTAAAVFDRISDGSLHLVIGKGVGCDDSSHDHVIEVELRSRLAPDGSATWALGRISVERADARPIGTATASVREAPDPEGRLAITLAFEVPQRGAFAPSLGVHGTVHATECHRTMPAFSPPVRERVRSSATMTIAGRTFPIAGALRRGADVELSDAPRSCSATWLTKATLVHTREGWSLGGGLFTTKQRGVATSLAATPGRSGTDTVSLTLSGAASIGGYAVRLAGDIDALECPPANATPAGVTIGRTPTPPGADLDRLTAKGHTGGDDNDDLIDCASREGVTWCYAHTRDGETAGCLGADRITIDMIRSIPSYGIVAFDWEPGTLGIVTCVGVVTYREPGDRAKP
jgi:hypothetical protein